MGRWFAWSLLTLATVLAARARADSESYFDEEEQKTGDGAATDERAPPDVPQFMRGTKVYVGVLLGAGGTLRPEGSDSDPLTPSIGLLGGMDYLLDAFTPYAAVGAELRLIGFSSDVHDALRDSRSWLFDLAIKPRARYAFSDQLEVYGTLPFGPSYVAIADDWSEDAGLGFNLGVGPGATLMFDERLGMNAELLYLFHWYGTESNVVGTAETRYRVSQTTFFVSLVVGL